MAADRNSWTGCKEENAEEDHQRESDEASAKGLFHESQPCRDAHHEDQIPAIGVRLADFSSKGAEILRLRDLGQRDDRDDHAGEQHGPHKGFSCLRSLK